MKITTKSIPKDKGKSTTKFFTIITEINKAPSIAPRPSNDARKPVINYVLLNFSKYIKGINCSFCKANILKIGVISSTLRIGILCIAWRKTRRDSIQKFIFFDPLFTVSWVLSLIHI